ncbi:MAG: hypothetical protein K8M05_42310 [Deltaproteobacteria bacterium]|nr:hypothetical protein [Kofleriaceae bacterium]
MPTYITDCRIDWGWPARTDPERRTIEAYHPRLDDHDHTLETFAELLGRASAELPAVPIAALVDDEVDSRTLLLARDGAVTRVLVKDSSRRYSITLGQDDKVRALLAADKAALFPVDVSAHDRLVAGETRQSRALFFPEPMLAWLQAEAARLDRSLSHVVQLAWTHARTTIAALPDRDAAAPLRQSYPSAANAKQTLYFPAELLVEAEAAAARFDTSLSWVFQLALSIAAPALRA